jgi:5'(3')-deoxyribonucleotidase
MEMETDDRVADVDLDGTVADYDRRMQEELFKLMAPEERVPPTRAEAHYDDAPHMSARRHLIKSMPGFWRNLPRLERGFEVVEVLREIGFPINVLTKGPEKVFPAWTEKVEWAAEHMPYASVTITHHKFRHYARVLVDDWPRYFLPWLEVRPRGLVIAVAQPWNAGIEHPNLIRYDGTNLAQVRERAQRAFDRKPREAL